MDVYQSGISKVLLFSTSNLVSYMLIKSHHFTWAYHVLLHKTSHTSWILFFWFPHVGNRESTPCFFEVRFFVALLLHFFFSKNRIRVIRRECAPFQGLPFNGFICTPPPAFTEYKCIYH